MTGTGRGRRPGGAGPAIAIALALLTASATPAAAADPAVAERAARILSLEGDVAYGEYLAGDCATCHSTASQATGVPPIVGLDAEHFIAALVEYDLGVRANEVMRTRAKSLGDEEMAALAAYFATVSQ